MLAAKAALATRCDALGEETNTDMAKVEARIRQLEGGEVIKLSGIAKQSAKFYKYESKSEVIEYKAAADVTIKRKAEEDDDEEPATKKVKVEEVRRRRKRRKTR